jgi:hypothetical protein
MLWTQINDWMHETASPFMGALAGRDFCRVWQPLGRDMWYSSGDTYSYSSLEEAKEAAEASLARR